MTGACPPDAELKRFLADQMGDAEMQALFGPSEDGMMQSVCPEVREKALALYFEEYQRQLRLCPAPFPEIVSALALLKERRVPAGLVTGKGQVTALMSLRLSFLKSRPSRFSYVCGTDLVI